MVDSRLGGGVDPGFETRVGVIAAAVILAFILFFLRLVQLQIVEGEDLQRRSERNSIHKQRVEAPRGEIYDRDNNLLATTRPAYGVQVLPSELKKRQVTLSTLAELIGDTPKVAFDHYGCEWGQHYQEPLWAAVNRSKGGHDLVKLLLNYGGNVTHKNSMGSCPLYIPKESSSHSLLKVLEDSLESKIF